MNTILNAPGQPKIKRHYSTVRKWKGKKERWLTTQTDGIAIRDATKSSNEGLYVFKMRYDWGKRADGMPMVGELLAIAPYYQVNGEVLWRARQAAARGGQLKWQYDLTSIDPTMGFELADAILRLLGQQGLTAPAAEQTIEELEQQKKAARLDSLIDSVFGRKE